MVHDLGAGSDKRHHDKVWKYAYGVLVAAVLVGGVYGVVHRNKSYTALSNPDFVLNPGSCPITSGRSLQEEDRGGVLPEELDLVLTQFMTFVGGWMSLTVLLGLLIGVPFLRFFNLHPQLLTKMAVWVPIACALAVGVGCMLGHQINNGLASLLAGVIATPLFWLWRSKFDLAGRVLGASARGTIEDSSLMHFVVLLHLSLWAALAPMFVFLTYAYTNGAIVPNGARAGSSLCADPSGGPVQCCIWRPDRWVAPYLAITGATIVWTVSLASRIKVFVISGAVVERYFGAPLAREGGSAAASVVPWLRRALGPALGPLCCGAAVLPLVEWPRSVLERVHSRKDGSTCCCLTSCLCKGCFAPTQYLSTFATVRLAIGGGSFRAAGRDATELLRRTLRCGTGVWWFPPTALTSGLVLLGLAWGVLSRKVNLAYLDSWHPTDVAAEEDTSVILGAFLIVMVPLTLGTFVSVLTDALQATTICYALDKEMESVTNEDVHEVFDEVLGQRFGSAHELETHGPPPSAAPLNGTYVPPRQEQI